MNALCIYCGQRNGKEKVRGGPMHCGNCGMTFSAIIANSIRALRNAGPSLDDDLRRALRQIVYYADRRAEGGDPFMYMKLRDSDGVIEAGAGNELVFLLIGGDVRPDRAEVRCQFDVGAFASEIFPLETYFESKEGYQDPYRSITIRPLLTIRPLKYMFFRKGAELAVVTASELFAFRDEIREKGSSSAKRVEEG